MKKTIILVVIGVCMLFTGCNNSFAEKEYNSSEKIAESEDHYAKKNSVFNPIEGGYSLKVSEFDGRETLWSKRFDDNKDIEIEIHLSLSEGSAKIVYVDENGEVLTIAECSSETTKEIDVTKTVSFTSGLNRIKIVGKDCADIELEILSSDF